MSEKIIFDNEFDWWVATMKAMGYKGGNEPAFIIIDEVHVMNTGEDNG